jgi:hypothetical protein
LIDSIHGVGFCTKDKNPPAINEIIKTTFAKTRIRVSPIVWEGVNYLEKMKKRAYKKMKRRAKEKEQTNSVGNSEIAS